MMQDPLPGNFRFVQKSEGTQQFFRQIAPVGIRMKILHRRQNPLPQEFLLIRIQFKRQMNVNPPMVIGHGRQVQSGFVSAG